MRREKILITLVSLIGIFMFLFLFKIDSQAATCTACGTTACGGGTYEATGGCSGSDWKCCNVATPVPDPQGGGNTGEGSKCCRNTECASGLHCEPPPGASTGVICGNWGEGTCTRNGGGGGGGGGFNNPTEVNLKCNCTNEFSACEDKFGKTNVQWRQCTRKVNGSETCNLRVGLKLYQTKACEAGPTVTPGGPTLTPTPTGTVPTPTDNPNCKCNALNSCTNACTFDKYTDVTYNNPIKCGVANNKFQSNPTNANKDAWCRAEKKTKGDADLNGVVNLLDYFYFLQSKVGAKIPVTTNPDFNGDNQINDQDSAIIIKTLKTGGF